MRSFTFTLLTLVVTFLFISVDATAHGHSIQRRSDNCVTKACLTTRLQKQRAQVKVKQRALSSAEAAASKIIAQLARSKRGGNGPGFVRKQKAFEKKKALAVADVTAKKLALRAAQKQVTVTEFKLNQTPAVDKRAGARKKRGICFNDVALSRQYTPVITWSYDWDQIRPAGLPSSVAYVPMLWGKPHLQRWKANADAAVKAGATHLLGFNEPDLGSQAAMTVTEAVTLWKQYMEPYASKAKLVSPAVTGSPDGLKWLGDFVKQCTGCHISALAVHWYDSATNVPWFKLYLLQAHALGYPVWLTEFAGRGTVQQQTAFFNEVIPWLEQTPWIERYSAFGDFVGTFVQADGSLTQLGSAYAQA